MSPSAFIAFRPKVVQPYYNGLESAASTNQNNNNNNLNESGVGAEFTPIPGAGMLLNRSVGSLGASLVSMSGGGIDSLLQLDQREKQPPLVKSTSSAFK